MQRILARAFARWLPLLAAVTGVFLFAAWGIQQMYRLGLDDPQIEMAEDAARALAGGVTPEDVVATGKPQIDMRQDLAPWIAVYDASGKPVASSGELDNAMPALPPGVFDTSAWRRFVIGHHFNESPPAEFRFSWEPRYADAPGGLVRQAVVLERVDSPAFTGYVAAGRNMRLVEGREDALKAGAAVLWGATALGTLVVIIFLVALGWL